MVRSKVNSGAVIATVLGLIIMVIGIYVYVYGVRISNLPYHNSTITNVPSASFGADYYTYTYDALDNIHEQLVSVDSGISSEISMIERGVISMSKTIGILITCIGIATIANAVTKINIWIPVNEPDDQNGKKGPDKLPEI